MISVGVDSYVAHGIFDIFKGHLRLVIFACVRQVEAKLFNSSKEVVGFER